MPSLSTKSPLIILLFAFLVTAINNPDALPQQTTLIAPLRGEGERGEHEFIKRVSVAWFQEVWHTIFVGRKLVNDGCMVPFRKWAKSVQNTSVYQHEKEVFAVGYETALKRGIHGTYVSVEPYHLHRYLDEQTFRYNQRKLDDAGRFQLALSQIVGKRIMYDELTGKAAMEKQRLEFSQEVEAWKNNN